MNPRFFKNLGPIKISTIKDLIDFESFNTNDEMVFTDLSSIGNLKKKGLSFLTDSEYLSKYNYRDGTIICSKSTQKKFRGSNPLIVVNNIHETVAVLSNKFYRSLTINEIDLLESPKIDINSTIANSAIIENGSVIGKNVKINPGCFIGYNCVIGDNVTIGCNSVVSNSIIAENVNVGRNVSMGQEGFGFSVNQTKNDRIFHIGRVILQSGVNIGSNCTIDRGSFGDTIIGENTFFDNLCHIAHNVIVGRNCVFAGMTGIAGSANIGDNVMTGGQTGIGGHLNIGNNVQIAAQSGVITDLEDNSTVMGYPAINKFKYIKKFKTNYA